ncbi:unnamed protein product [Pipistrellus nathusii]|uniref:Uncharacterized protein n=1 Tax=Pipistrellus nathusii TaxID=59473 RepID=A0ABN9Z7Q3_PIPNA
MAIPERLTGGFELANGRAPDRVSEKEAEAGRSRRCSRTTSAAASPWHDPGLRVQRLHKEAFLGAAVSLLDSCCATWTVERSASQVFIQLPPPKLPPSSPQRGRLMPGP